jgi:hypothetical protein
MCTHDDKKIMVLQSALPVSDEQNVAFLPSQCSLQSDCRKMKQEDMKFVELFYPHSYKNINQLNSWQYNPFHIQR